MPEMEIELDNKINLDKRIDVLIAMHNYNESSGRHHEESGRRGANVFMLIYFFLSGVIISNGLNFLSFFVALLLVAIAIIGYSMTRQHSSIARMHYYRNRLIRSHIDELFSAYIPSLTQIFHEGREKFAPFELYAYSYSAYHRHWAQIHLLFIVIGLSVFILDTINQASCFRESGCFWTKGSEITNLLPYLKGLFPNSFISR